MLKNNLKAVCDDATITEALEMLGKPENTRAQDLSMPQYVALFNFVRDAGQAKVRVGPFPNPGRLCSHTRLTLSFIYRKLGWRRGTDLCSAGGAVRCFFRKDHWIQAETSMT